MGLVSFLLHCNACNAGNLVLEILKHGKILREQFASASPLPSLQILGDWSPHLRVIYAHALTLA